MIKLKKPLSTTLIILLLFSFLLTLTPRSQAQGSSVPQGLIAFYNGNVESIPAEWYLCNGSNGTPDLLSVMLYGADGGDVNTTGAPDLRDLFIRASDIAGSTYVSSLYCLKGITKVIFLKAFMNRRS